MAPTISPSFTIGKRVTTVSFPLMGHMSALSILPVFSTSGSSEWGSTSSTCRPTAWSRLRPSKSRKVWFIKVMRASLSTITSAIKVLSTRTSLMSSILYPGIYSSPPINSFSLQRSKHTPVSGIIFIPRPEPSSVNLNRISYGKKSLMVKLEDQFFQTWDFRFTGGYHNYIFDLPGISSFSY